MGKYKAGIATLNTVMLEHGLEILILHRVFHYLLNDPVSRIRQEFPVVEDIGEVHIILGSGSGQAITPSLLHFHGEVTGTECRFESKIMLQLHMKGVYMLAVILIRKFTDSFDDLVF